MFDKNWSFQVKFKWSFCYHPIFWKAHCLGEIISWLKISWKASLLQKQSKAHCRNSKITLPLFYMANMIMSLFFVTTWVHLLVITELKKYSGWGTDILRQCQCLSADANCPHPLIGHQFAVSVGVSESWAVLKTDIRSRQHWSLRGSFVVFRLRL